MPKKETLLGPLITDSAKLKREATKRRSPYDHVSVAKTRVDEYISDGWMIERPLKTKTRLRRLRGCDRQLENRVWMLLFLLGYHELNADHNFSITVERKGAESLRKQIDVFAKDEETVIVAECKANMQLRKRSLQKDIEEFANLKGPIANSIKKHYGASFKPKIVWLFVTQNIIWSEPDKQRAAGENIRVITDSELPYYLQIADHLRKAARFQFLAEFLKDQKIPELQGKTVPAIRGTLGGTKFYCFVTTPAELLKISFVNHRSLNDPDGLPTYQRLVSRSRLIQIGKFLKDGGFFPTNLLINFTRKVRFDAISKDKVSNVAYGTLYMPDRYRSAWIIDGQHRLYGYAPLDNRYLDQNIVVLAFEELPKVQEANLFVTINHEQKSVPKTLLDDLEGELKWGSDIPTERIGAIGARLIQVLNADINEPLYGRVTKQGITATEKTCLTVPALKDGLRRSGLIGSAILRRKEFEPGPLSGTTDTETLERARAAINQYLNLLRSCNHTQWERGRGGYLCTNVSLQGYFLLLAALIQYMEANKSIAPRELAPQELISEVEEYLDPILKWLAEAKPSDMEREFKVQFGSGGPREYYFRLCRIVKSTYSDFQPEEMREWEEERSEERIEAADRKLKDLNIRVQKYIFERFRKEYGTEKGAYFDKGIIDKKIKSRAYEKSLEDEPEERLPLEHYLDFIEYKKIVEHKAHWPMFRSVFDIVEPGEKKYSKNVRWMDRINELRRIPAHPTEMKHYKLDDFDYIDYIHTEFLRKLEQTEATNDG